MQAIEGEVQGSTGEGTGPNENDRRNIEVNLKSTEKTYEHL